MAASNPGGIAEIAILSLYLASLRPVNRSSGKCNALSCDGHGKFITLVAGKRPSLLMAGKNDEVVNLKPK